MSTSTIQYQRRTVLLANTRLRTPGLFQYNYMALHHRRLPSSYS
jgi:hypothetical protein